VLIKPSSHIRQRRSLRQRFQHQNTCKDRLMGKKVGPSKNGSLIVTFFNALMVFFLQSRVHDQPTRTGMMRSCLRIRISIMVNPVVLVRHCVFQCAYPVQAAPLECRRVFSCRVAAYWEHPV
jgi:hypothetical protein